MQAVDCPPVRCVFSDTVREQGLEVMDSGSDRYDEFVAMLLSMGLRLEDINMWREQCTGATYCPPIRCVKHNSRRLPSIIW